MYNSALRVRRPPREPAAVARCRTHTHTRGRTLRVLHGTDCHTRTRRAFAPHVAAMGRGSVVSHDSKRFTPVVPLPFFNNGYEC